MPETNGIDLVGRTEGGTITLAWTDPRLDRIVRIRYVADSYRGPWDLSYVHGETTEGDPCRVTGLPYQIHRPGGAVIGELIGAARRESIYLKGLCGGDIGAVVSLCW